MKAILFYSFVVLAIASFMSFFNGNVGSLLLALICGMMALLVACIAKEDAENEELKLKNKKK